MLRFAAEAWRYVRTRGLGKTLQRIWEAYIFSAQAWVIFLNPLDGPPVAPASDGIVFRPHSPADLPLLEAFEPHYRTSEIRARLAEGCWLDLALDGDRPVAFRLVSASAPRRGPQAKVVRLKPDQVLVVDLFCLPGYRERGIGMRLGFAMDRRLGALGYRECLKTARTDNLASLRLIIRRGDKPICVVSHFRVLFYSKQRVSHDVGRVFEAAGLPNPITTGP